MDKTPAARINDFLRKATMTVYGLSVARGLLRAAPALFCSFVALGALNHQFDFPSWAIKLLWLLIVIGVLILFASGFFPLRIFSLKEKSKNLQVRVPQLRSDDLLVAIELVGQVNVSNGISSELRE